jgi:hypothetical protein
MVLSATSFSSVRTVLHRTSVVTVVFTKKKIDFLSVVIALTLFLIRYSLLARIYDWPLPDSVLVCPVCLVILPGSTTLGVSL